ncbi:MAG: magnesium transporter [Myxococcales bacterium]|nr:magnesium transporter [Myxococcales bacterium]
MLEAGRPAEDEVDELELLTRPGREDELKTFLLLLHPADIAGLFEELDEAAAAQVFRNLPPDRAAEMLAELDPEVQERLFSSMKPDVVAPVVGRMETDDAADLLQELDEATAKTILQVLPKKYREDLNRLLKFDPYTAGGLMQTELARVPLSSTVGTALDAVRKAADNIDIISLFVVDDGGHYAGNVALQDLVLSKPERPVEQIMEPKVVEVLPDVDQEEVARIFDHYSLVELGVVDENGLLLGRITADDVHEVLVEEAEEDMLKLAGTAAEAQVIYSNRVFSIVGQRLPWLASTFFAGLLASWILSSASVVFQTAVILLMFVPVITGMSGNVGTQSAMIMIQGMASGHVEPENVGEQIVKDILVCLIMAVTCGVAATLIVSLWRQSWGLGLCVGTALTLSMVVASILGSTEPALLKRFGIDPAVAAGPLITSINDISGVLIYTVVALLFLDYLS